MMRTGTGQKKRGCLVTSFPQPGQGGEGRAGCWACQHDGIADGFDQLVAGRRRLVDEADKAVEEVHRVKVAVGFGQSGEAGRVDKAEGPLHRMGAHPNNPMPVRGRPGSAESLA